MVAQNFKLYTEVQLTKNLPELGFMEGDVATIVDIIIKSNNQKIYCLEFFDAQGKTIDVALVGEADRKRAATVWYYLNTYCSKRFDC